MKLACIISLFLFALEGFCQIGVKTKTATSLQGKWVNTLYGYSMELVLEPDGKGSLDGESMTYTVSGNELITNWNNEIIKYSYVLNGNSLTLSGGDLDGEVVFSRQGTNTIAAQSQQAQSTIKNDGNLVGTWAGQNEEIAFMANGNMTYNGVEMKYSTSGNIVTLQGLNGNVDFEYTVTGNQLSLKGNGQTFVYKKAVQRSGNSNGQEAKSKGAVALEMVGKWCYVNVTSTNSGGWSTDECFTLYENGTYEYHSENSGSASGYDSYGNQLYAGGTSGNNSDSGTWSVSGNTLIVNSQTRGQLVYEFQKQNHPKNNDPMIVINGRAYVTQYQKAPWR